jgi:hypothetical protein
VKKPRPTRPSRPRPPAPECLDRGRRSNQRGGTLLAERMRTLEQHQRALADAEQLRPYPCPTCGTGRMHVHEYRTRKPKGDESLPPEITVLRFRCAACDAVWLVLPVFLARHLWRVWTTVGVILGGEPRRGVTVPRATRLRWKERMATVGRKLTSVLVTAGERLATVAVQLGLDPSRNEVVVALGGVGHLAAIAALIDRLAPAVRVM